MNSMVSPRRTLITGAARPLGVELVRQCLLRGDKVYAAARNPARVPVLADLRAEFGGLELLALDPADPSLVADAVPVLEGLTDRLDQLIIAPAEPGQHEKLADLERDETLATLSGTGLTEHYRRHAVAPLLLVRTLLPFLANRDGARVLVVSSWLGSLTGKTQGGDYATCASSAALHMHMRALAHDLSDAFAHANPLWFPELFGELDCHVAKVRRTRVQHRVNAVADSHDFRFLGELLLQP